MNKKAFKEKLRDIAHDLLLCSLIGCGIAVGLSLILLLVSGLASGFQLYTMLNVVRSGLLITGALLLFVVAGVILGQKSNQKIRSSAKWKATFWELGPTFVFLVMAAAVLLIATVVDYIVWLS